MRSRSRTYLIAFPIAASIGFSLRIWQYALSPARHVDLRGEMLFFGLPAAVLAISAIILANRLLRKTDGNKRMGNALLILAWIALLLPVPAGLLID
jgi:hypothetical protein